MVKSSLLIKNTSSNGCFCFLPLLCWFSGSVKPKKVVLASWVSSDFWGVKFYWYRCFFSTPASRKNQKKTLQWCNLTPKQTLILSKHPRTLITYHLFPIRVPHQQLSYQNNLFTKKKSPKNCSAMSNKESIPKTQPISRADPNLLPPSIHLSNLPDIDSARWRPLARRSFKPKLEIAVLPGGCPVMEGRIDLFVNGGCFT